MKMRREVTKECVQGKFQNMFIENLLHASHSTGSLYKLSYLILTGTSWDRKHALPVSYKEAYAQKVKYLM